jgi:hypothetical protein
MTGIVAVGSSAVLGVIFCLFVSHAGHPICVAALMGQTPSAQQRPECVAISGLERPVGLIKEIVSTSSDPRANILVRKEQNKSALITLRRGTMMKDVALRIGKTGCFLNGLPFGRFELLVPTPLPIFGEVMIAQGSSQSTNDGSHAKSGNVNIWIEVAHQLFQVFACGVAGGLIGALIIHRLMTPNDPKLSHADGRAAPLAR